MNDLSSRALVTIEEARMYVYRDENDASRDGILIDALNDVSESIWDHCEREFKPTTIPDRSGTDGVANGTTTFTAASGAFVAADVGKIISITARGLYTIASVTNGTTVVLSGSPAAGTSLAWDFGEARLFPVTAKGYIDLKPYDLRSLQALTLYSDRPTTEQDVLTADEYQLLPSHGTSNGTVFHLQTIPPALGALQTGFGWRASVRGQWGMATVPNSVRFACKQWVKNIVENPGSYAAAAMSGYAISPDADTITIAPAGMPAAVRYRLERWARGYALV
jgi:hypothetical protein